MKPPLPPAGAGAGVAAGAAAGLLLLAEEGVGAAVLTATFVYGAVTPTDVWNNLQWQQSNNAVQQCCIA